MTQLFIDGNCIKNEAELRESPQNNHTLFPKSNAEVIRHIPLVEDLEALTLLDIDFSEKTEELTRVIVSSTTLKKLTVCNCYSVDHLLQALAEETSFINDLTISFDPTCSPDLVAKQLITIIEKNKVLRSLVIHFNLSSEVEGAFKEKNVAFLNIYSETLDHIINSLEGHEFLIKFEFFPKYKQDEINNYLEINKTQFFDEGVFVNFLVSYLNHNPKASFEEFFSHLEAREQNVAFLSNQTPGYEIEKVPSTNASVTIKNDHPNFSMFRTGFLTQIISKNIAVRKTVSGARIVALQIKNAKGKNLEHTKITLKDTKITILQNFQSLQIFQALAAKVFAEIMQAEVSQKSEEGIKREQLLNIGKFIWYLVHCIPYLADGSDWKVNIAVRVLFAKFALPFKEKFPIYHGALVEFTVESFAEYFVARYREILLKIPEGENDKINSKVSTEVEKLQTALIPFLTDKSIFRFSFASELSVIINKLNRDLGIFHGVGSRLNNSSDELRERVLLLVEATLEKFYSLKFYEQNLTCARILVHARDSLIQTDFNGSFPSLVADNTVSINSPQKKVLLSFIDGRICNSKTAKEKIEILGDPEEFIAQTFLPITIEKIGEVIDKQTQLEFLELTNVNFTDKKEFAASLAKKIAGKSSLQTLVLYTCRSTEIFLVELANFKLNITDLRIRFIDIYKGLFIKNDNGLGFVPAIIQNCKNLRTLIISASCKDAENFIEKEQGNLDSIVRAVGSNMNIIRFELSPPYKFEEITSIINRRLKVEGKTKSDNILVNPSETERQQSINSFVKTIIDCGVELLDKTPGITCKEVFNWIARNLHMMAVIDDDKHLEEGCRQRMSTLKSHIKPTHSYFKVFNGEYLRLKSENLPRQGEYELLISDGDIKYSRFRFSLENNAIQKIIIEHTMPEYIDYVFQELQSSFDTVIYADERMSTVAGRVTFLMKLFEIVWKVSQLSPYTTDNDVVIEIAIRIFFNKNGFAFPENIPLIYPRALIVTSDAEFFKRNVDKFLDILRVSADEGLLAKFNEKIEKDIDRLLIKLEHFSSKRTQQIRFFSNGKTSACLVDELIDNLNLLKNSKMESDLFLFNAWITINSIKVEYEKLLLSNPICLEILRSVEQRLGEIKLMIDENNLPDFVPEITIEEDKPPIPQTPFAVN